MKRFWSKVDKRGESDCWEWTAHKNNDGYGKFRMNNKSLAHRASWEIAKGAIPEGLCVLHRCDNPGCVNPSHLFLGTRKDNARDRDIKGRRTPPKGESNGRSKLTRENVIEIRKRYADGGISLRKLGKLFGCSGQQVYRIVSRTRWKHVEVVGP